MPEDVSAREGYDRWAASYDASPNPVVAMDDQVLGDFIPEVTGRVVVDAGCGTGRHTLRLARAAKRVIAMDFSPKMLGQVAAKLAAEGLANVTLVEHDLHRPIPLDDGCADGLVCALVGEHLNELAPVFAEFARLLRPGGWMVFSVYHPFLALAGKEANFRDPRSGTEVRLGAVKHLAADYVNAVLDTCLGLELMREICATEDEWGERIPSFERYRDKPLLLILRARKPAA